MVIVRDCAILHEEFIELVLHQFFEAFGQQIQIVDWPEAIQIGSILVFFKWGMILDVLNVSEN